MKKILFSMFVLLAGTSTWAQRFTADGETLTITTAGDMTSAEVAANVAARISSDNPTSVIVDGGGIVGDAFVHAILYPNNGVNKTLEELDMKGVTLSNWTVGTFRNGASDTWMFGQLALRKLTLPLVKANAEGAVVVPSDAFTTVGSYGSFPFTSIVIPEGYTEVGAYAFNGQDKVESVAFPNSLKVIGDMAFANLNNCQTITLNNGLEFIGNSAFALTAAKTNKTLDIPASVKYMGPAAFLCRRYQEVYFRGVEAPMCPIGKSIAQPYYPLQGTFGAETLMGNNGLEDSQYTHPTADVRANGYANRENYINGGAYFCILHYPTNLTAEQEAKYTDITKKYESWSKTEMVWENGQQVERTKFYEWNPRQVGKENVSLSFGNFSIANINGSYNMVHPGYKDTYLGEQLVWPSQSQWMRSYLTASNGVCWDGVTAYRPTLTAEQIALLRQAGYSEAEYSVDDLAKIAFVGTRQFVLGNGDVKSQGHDYTINVKGGKWNTLCVPFNMTKKMVDETLGQGTQVCRFSFVDRKFDNKAGNHITLLFRNDVYKHKTEKIDGEYEEFDANAEAPEDDDIVIYAHEAYMVKPTKTDEDPKAFLVDMFEAEPGSPLPTYVCAKNREIVNGFELQAADDDVCRYRFIGHYQASTKSTYTLAPNVYYFGRLKASDPGKFWFYNGKKVVKWNANSCIIQQEDTEIGEQDAESFFNVRPGESASAKQSSLFGDMELEGNTTGVEHIEIVAGENAEAIVYSLDGQVVNRNGETNHLPNGIYVKNGKKFIVK